MTTVFSKTRTDLISPEKQDERQRIMEGAGLYKKYASIAMGLSGVVTLVSCVSIAHFLVIGALFTVIGGIGTTLAREAMILFTNVEELMGSSLEDRTAAAESSRAFVDRLLKNTWVIGLFLRSKAIEQLEQHVVNLGAQMP